MAPDRSPLMRWGFVVIAILCILIIERLTMQEPPAKIRTVKEPIFVTHPPPLAPKPAAKRRATLDDVRRDWEIEGRLVCEVRQRR